MVKVPVYRSHLFLEFCPSLSERGKSGEVLLRDLRGDGLMRTQFGGLPLSLELLHVDVEVFE